MAVVPARGAPSLIVPWLAHLYTALGAGTALAATLDIFAGEFRRAFLWLALAVIIDTTDGVLARALRVKERLPFFDGGKLDDIIDYQTYVLVPVLLMIRADLLPPGAAVWIGVAILLASGYGFSRTDAKVVTTEYFFTGFPSYWNIVALYLFAWRLPATWAAAILLFLVVMVFVPLRFVYPSRTRTWQTTTNLLGVAWGAAILWVVWTLPTPPLAVVWSSLLFPAYYLVLSIVLDRRSRTASPSHVDRVPS